MCRALAGVLGVVVVAGCGVVYTSPSVSDGGIFGEDSAALDVEIVPVTYETTLAANLMPNVPARLPLGMQPEVLDRLPSTGAPLPELLPMPAPPSQPGIRPGRIADRLPPAESPQPYRIGIADVLLISANAADATLDELPSIVSAQAKRQGFVVQDDGAIAIPDAGRVRVAGSTLQDAEAAIFQALVSAGIDPSFSLEIAEFNSQRVAVGGEVGEPSLVPITLKPLYLHEAISASGGLTVPDPKVARIVLTRDGESYQLGVERLINDPALQNIVLRDGDSVYAESEFREERARNRFSEIMQIRGEQQNQYMFRFQAENARAQEHRAAVDRLLAEQQIFKDRLALGAIPRQYAYVTGEVTAPKRIPLPFENTAVLADILFNESGGGISIQTGDYGEIYVLRRPANPEEIGRVTAFHLDAGNAANLTLAGMFEMHDGDVVFVAEQPVTAWNRVLNQTLPQLFTGLVGTASGL